MNEQDKKVEIYVKEIALGIAENRAKFYHKQMIQAEISAHTLRVELRALKSDEAKE